jgi:hypothetical protein
VIPRFDDFLPSSNGFVNVRVRVDRKAARSHSIFSLRIGPITGLNSTHVVKEVGTGALFWLRVPYLSLVRTKKAANLAAFESVDAHPYAWVHGPNQPCPKPFNGPGILVAGSLRSVRYKLSSYAKIFSKQNVVNKQLSITW